LVPGTISARRESGWGRDGVPRQERHHSRGEAPAILEENEGAHAFRHVQREVQGDAPACRVTHHVRGLEAQVIQEGSKRVRFAVESQRPGQSAAGPVAGAVIAQHAVAIDEDGFLEQRAEPVATGAVVDENNRFTGPVIS